MAVPPYNKNLHVFDMSPLKSGRRRLMIWSDPVTPLFSWYLSLRLCLADVPVSSALALLTAAAVTNRFCVDVAVNGL